ncbi:MAG: hypothetical protein WCT04_09620 [Planctomycetota bacterium]
MSDSHEDMIRNALAYRQRWGDHILWLESDPLDKWGIPCFVSGPEDENFWVRYHVGDTRIIRTWLWGELAEFKKKVLSFDEYFARHPCKSDDEIWSKFYIPDREPPKPKERAVPNTDVADYLKHEWTPEQETEVRKSLPKAGWIAKLMGLTPKDFHVKRTLSVRTAHGLLAGDPDIVWSATAIQMKFFLISVRVAWRDQSLMIWEEFPEIAKPIEEQFALWGLPIKLSGVNDTFHTVPFDEWQKIQNERSEA